jgi:hypothetical protein
VADKPITPLRDGLDVFLPGRVVVQRLPEHGDRAVQGAFLDEAVRPHLFQEVVLLDQMPTVFDEDPQQGEDLGRERHRAAIAQQPMVPCLQAERSELIRRLACRGHRASGQDARGKSWGFLRGFCKDYCQRTTVSPWWRRPRRRTSDETPVAVHRCLCASVRV